MTKKTSSEIIEAYRKRSKTSFSATDIVKGSVILLILAISIYFASTGGPGLPALIDLETNPLISIPSATLSPPLFTTENLTDDGCNCLPTQEISSQAVVTVIVVVTPTHDTGSASSETQSPNISKTPMASLTPTPTPTLYVVQPKDTLSDIALRFNLTVEAIQAANGMGDSTLILEGQTLIIPR